MSHDKGDIIQDLYTVDSLCQPFYGQYFVTNLSVWTEINIRILSAGRFDFIQFDFLQSFLSGSSLFGFGSICRETLDKILKFLDFFFLLFVRFFHLFYQKLAGFVPEIIISCI